MELSATSTPGSCPCLEDGPANVAAKSTHGDRDRQWDTSIIRPSAERRLDAADAVRARDIPGVTRCADAKLVLSTRILVGRVAIVGSTLP